MPSNYLIDFCFFFVDKYFEPFQVVNFDLLKKYASYLYKRSNFFWCFCFLDSDISLNLFQL